MGKYFGTDGIRGTFGEGLMTTHLAYRLGSALGLYFSRKKPGLPLNAVIGRDTRMSGPALADALTLGLNRRGVFVHDGGIVPTPAVARAVVEQQADFGVAITASHNPAADNGLKVFDGYGTKLDEAVELEIEALMDAEPSMTSDLPPPRSYQLDVAANYINYMRSLLDQNCLYGWKIVLDTANGATCETSPAVFRHWGAEVVQIGDNPDGDNINFGVGSEYPERLGQKVREVGAHLGIAHDGDGDRLVVCDENGSVVDGDVLLGLFGMYAVRSGALRSKSLVATVQSNLGLDQAIGAAGGKVQRVDVGDRNVAAAMRAGGSNIGGESSGHIIFSDFATTGDGLLAAVKLVELICKTSKSLSELAGEIPLFPQQLLNLRVAEKRPLEGLARVNRAVARASERFGAKGRVMVRYSGTEPKLRILAEGEDPWLVAKAIKEIAAAARRDLKVIDS